MLVNVFSAKLDATTPRSYKGISLLPVASKLMERVAKHALSTFLDEEHVLSDYQFGFRCGRSTEDLLSLAVSDCSRNMDEGLSTVIAFIDLSKAFDKVNHQALLFPYSNVALVVRRSTGLPVIFPVTNSV